jgi:hypothetical protein
VSFIWQGQEIFLFFLMSSLALAPTQPHNEWALGVKWVLPEADKSLPYSAMVKIAGSFTTIILSAFLSCRGATVFYIKEEHSSSVFCLPDGGRCTSMLVPTYQTTHC